MAFYRCNDTFSSRLNVYYYDISGTSFSAQQVLDFDDETPLFMINGLRNNSGTDKLALGTFENRAVTRWDFYNYLDVTDTDGKLKALRPCRLQLNIGQKAGTDSTNNSKFEVFVNNTSVLASSTTAEYVKYGETILLLNTGDTFYISQYSTGTSEGIFIVGYLLDTYESNIEINSRYLTRCEVSKPSISPLFVSGGQRTQSGTNQNGMRRLKILSDHFNTYFSHANDTLTCRSACTLRLLLGQEIAASNTNKNFYGFLYKNNTEVFNTNDGIAVHARYILVDLPFEKGDTFKIGQHANGTTEHIICLGYLISGGIGFLPKYVEPEEGGELN